KSDSKLSGKSESYNAAASLSFIKNMTLTGSYSNNRRFTELTSDTTAESFKGKMGYVTSILRGPLAISSEYSSGKTSGKDITSISRESIQYRVGYSRLLTRFMAMSASYSHLDRKETNVADRIEDIWNLFLNCRFGAWTLSFETSLETREINRKTEVFRYVTRITRSISRRF
ncbi:MAG: hypothetical protein ACE5FU_08900, partial [Nitrospinota bacterium]